MTHMVRFTWKYLIVFKLFWSFYLLVASKMLKSESLLLSFQNYVRIYLEERMCLDLLMLFTLSFRQIIIIKNIHIERFPWDHLLGCAVIKRSNAVPLNEC